MTQAFFRLTSQGLHEGVDFAVSEDGLHIYTVGQ